MNNLIELKPCPFCGGKPVTFSCDGSGRYYAELGTVRLHGANLDHFLIKCEKCGIRTKTYLTKRGVFNA